MARIIIVAGGIGCGKSVVCNVLRALGCHVYDCDSRARQIMDADEQICRRIASDICAEAIEADSAGRLKINRQQLAAVVFADKRLLDTLNSLVHAAVKADIVTMAGHLENNETLFVESAIPVASSLYELASAAWQVTAPLELRLQRAASRDSCSRELILQRIEAQHIEENLPLFVPTETIANDGLHPVLPRILALTATLEASPN